MSQEVNPNARVSCDEYHRHTAKCTVCANCGGAHDGACPDHSLHSQASEEVWKLCERLTGRHDGPWAEGRACGHCDLIMAVVDRVSRERTRQALERAERAIEEKAESLYAWMLKCDLNSASRKEKSLRAGELFTAARLVRALLSDQESVASEEKEE